MPKIQLKPLYNSRQSPLSCQGSAMSPTRDLKGYSPATPELKSIPSQNDSRNQSRFDSHNQVHQGLHDQAKVALKGDFASSQHYWQTFTESEVPREGLCKTASYVTPMEVSTYTKAVHNGPTHLLTPPSWIDKFRDIYNNDKYLLKCWFWDNFNWNQNTIWIGKYHCIDQLPESNEEIIQVLNQLVSNLDQYPQIKSQVYLKFYFSRNIETNQPEINYLMLCNHTQLPAEFLNTTINQSFEKYQLTKAILDLDQDFKKMVNHYLNWSNFYIYYSLLEELQY